MKRSADMKGSKERSMIRFDVCGQDGIVGDPQNPPAHESLADDRSSGQSTAHATDEECA